MEADFVGRIYKRSLATEGTEDTEKKVRRQKKLKSCPYFNLVKFREI